MTGRFEELAPQDAARLHMEVRANPMVILAVLTLTGPLDDERLAGLLQSALPARFRQRIEEPRVGLARWVSDPMFDARAHVRRLGQGSLEAIANEVLNAPLPRSRPLWDVHLARDDQARSLLLFRAHHAIADGAHLLEVLGRLADEPAPARENARRPPRDTHASVRARAWHLLQGARGAIGLVMRRSDPRSPLRVRPRGHKYVAVTRAMDVARVLQRSRDARLGALTSMLLAVASGIERGVRGCPPVTLHALVPVPIARSPNDGSQGNQFASVFVPLPLGERDRGARARAIEAALVRARRRAPTAARVVEAAGVATAAIERLGVRTLSRRAVVMVSNVRGPERRVRLLGVEVTDMIAFAPSAGRIALAVTFMSYAGALRATVAMDASVAADPHDVASHLADELAPLPREA